MDKRLISILIPIIIGLCIGIFATYFYYQPKLIQQIKITNDQKKEINANQIEIISTKEQIASVSAQLVSVNTKLKVLQNTPPKVVYQTQYVETQAQPQSSSTHCNPDLIGGQNCYSDNGKYTHCVSDLIGGMTCY